MKAMKMAKIIGFFLGALLLSFGLVTRADLDTTKFINSFDVNPKSVSVSGVSSLEYTFKLVGTEADIKKLCVGKFIGNGNLYWYITGGSGGGNLSGRIPASDFLLDGTKTVGPVKFSFTPPDNKATSWPFRLEVSCDSSVAPDLFAESGIVTINLTGQQSDRAIRDFTFDANPKSATPSGQATFNFDSSILGVPLPLLKACGNNSNDLVITRVYKSQPSITQDELVFVDSNLIGNFPVYKVSDFQAGQRISGSFSKSITVPGGDFYFKARVTCQSDKVQLTASSAVQISAGGTGNGGVGGSGGGGTSTGTCGGTGQPICPPIPAGSSRSYTFNITNPLAGGPNDLFDIINIVTQWIIYISVPLAVLWIMYAGFLMLTAGPTPDNFKKGRDILKYTVLGLAIIFIGKGFVSLIISIIQLGGTGGTSSTTQNQSQQNQNQFQNSNSAGSANAGMLGNACPLIDNCQNGLKCNTMCQRPNGNAIGEPCYNGSNCAQGLRCAPSFDATGQSKKIDGQTVGECAPPTSAAN